MTGAGESADDFRGLRDHLDTGFDGSLDESDPLPDLGFGSGTDGDGGTDDEGDDDPPGSDEEEETVDSCAAQGKLLRFDSAGRAYCWGTTDEGNDQPDADPNAPGGGDDDGDDDDDPAETMEFVEFVNWLIDNAEDQVADDSLLTSLGDMGDLFDELYQERDLIPDPEEFPAGSYEQKAIRAFQRRGRGNLTVAEQEMFGLPSEYTEISDLLKVAGDRFTESEDLLATHLETFGLTGITLRDLDIAPGATNTGAFSPLTEEDLDDLEILQNVVDGGTPLGATSQERYDSLVARKDNAIATNPELEDLLTKRMNGTLGAAEQTLLTSLIGGITTKDFLNADTTANAGLTLNVALTGTEQVRLAALEDQLKRGTLVGGRRAELLDLRQRNTDATGTTINQDADFDAAMTELTGDNGPIDGAADVDFTASPGTSPTIGGPSFAGDGPEDFTALGNNSATGAGVQNTFLNSESGTDAVAGTVGTGDDFTSPTSAFNPDFDFNTNVVNPGITPGAKAADQTIATTGDDGIVSPITDFDAYSQKTTVDAADVVAPADATAPGIGDGSTLDADGLPIADFDPTAPAPTAVTTAGVADPDSVEATQVAGSGIEDGLPPVAGFAAGAVNTDVTAAQFGDVGSVGNVGINNSDFGAAALDQIDAIGEGDYDPLAGTDFLGDMSRKGIEELYNEMFTQATGGVTDSQRAAERAAGHDARAEVEQFLAADPFSTGARGLRGGITSALSGRERSRAGQAFGRELIQGRFASQQQARQDLLGFRSDLAGEELSRIEVGASIADQERAREIETLRETHSLALDDQKLKLDAKIADLDAEVQLAIAQGNADQEAALESRRMDLEQQIAINNQTLAALTASGDQAIGIAGLVETRELTQANLDLTARMDEINNEIEVARANNDASLEAALQAQRLDVESKLTTNNQRLNAMVSEGEQRISVAQMAETRAIEESRQTLQTNLANMEKDLAVAQQNGQMGLAGDIESRKLAVQQQMAINEQVLQAFTAEGQQSIDVASLLEQRNINQARMDLDVELANQQARMDVALAEGNNALAARIETQKNKLEKARLQKTLSLQALTEEGRQQLEDKSLELSASMENARNETTVSVANMEKDLARAVHNNDTIATARIEASKNRLVARQQKLDALIAEGDQITDRAALVLNGEISEQELLYERLNHVDALNAQVAIAEQEGAVQLADSLIQMRDNQLARSLNAAIASEELSLQEQTDLRKLIVNKDLGEARLKLDAILGEKQAEAAGLDTISGATEHSAALLAQLDEGEKDRLLGQSEFLDQFGLNAAQLDSDVALAIARLESNEDIERAETLISSMSAMGALNLDTVGIAFGVKTGQQDRKQDYVNFNAAEAADMITEIKNAAVNESAFKNVVEARKNEEVFKVSDFLTGSFFNQATLDNAEANTAISAVAVEKQATAALKELAIMSLNADANAARAESAGNTADWQKWIDLGSAAYTIGTGIGGAGWFKSLTGQTRATTTAGDGS
jgi:hypothetical protein